MISDAYFRYGSQPSKAISQEGTIVEGSYFLAHGFLHVSENQTYECDFEVAHMRDGTSWAIAYIRFASDLPSNDELVRPTILVGTEVMGRHIKVNSATVTRRRLKYATGAEYFVFLVHDYTVETDTISEKGQRSKVYLLTNLPVDDQLNPEKSIEADREQAYEAAEQAALIAVIDQAVNQANPAGKSLDEIRTVCLESAKEIKEHKLREAPPARRKTIPFLVEGKSVADLYWWRSREQQEYPSQPLSGLHVHENELPKGWTDDEVAEWICAVLSFALGNMITWNHNFIPSHDSDLPKPREHWLSRRVSSRAFTAFASQTGSLPSFFQLQADMPAIELVQSIVTFLFRTTSSETADYQSLLADYVYYASTSDEIQHRCTLLCALVESLFSAWKKYHHASIPDEMERRSRSTVLADVENSLRSHIKEILPQSPSEAPDIYERRCATFINDMRTKVSTDLKQSFAYRLRHLFASEGWQVDSTSSSGDIAARISTFVRSRDMLFHEHRFASQDDESSDDSENRRGLLQEVANIQLFVPLLFATVLNYHGKYWDTISRRWRRMPRPGTHKEEARNQGSDTET